MAGNELSRAGVAKIEGGVSLPSKNSPVYSDYAVKQAAREAADRILEAFDIKVREDGWFQ